MLGTSTMQYVNFIWICSESQPNDDSTASKYAAVWVLYIVVFDGYLFVSHLTTYNAEDRKQCWANYLNWRAGNKRLNEYKWKAVTLHGTFLAWQGLWDVDMIYGMILYDIWYDIIYDMIRYMIWYDIWYMMIYMT